MRARLRPWCFLSRSISTQTEPILRRFADKYHRSTFRSLETEYKRYRKNRVWILRPSVDHFLIWLRRKNEGNLDETKIGLPSGKRPINNDIYAEGAMFHVLACLYGSEDVKWLQRQTAYFQKFQALKKRLRRQCGKFDSKDCIEFARKAGFTVSDASGPLLLDALSNLSQAVQLQPNLDHFLPWIRSLKAENVTGACLALSNLLDIPAFVSADILLRTPLTTQELRLQLDLWQSQMASIAVAYFHRPSHVRNILDNILFYTVHFDLALLAPLVNSTLSLLTSTSLGYKFLVLTPSYLNSVIYNMATFALRHGHDGGRSHDLYSLGPTETLPPAVNTPDNLSSSSFGGVVGAQENTTKYLVGQHGLTQRGYMGIVVAVANENTAKAKKLFEIAQKHHPEHTTEFHFVNIYLATTPELLFQAFNIAAAQYPALASLWYIFARKLLGFHLLTEKRSQKLLREVLSRKDKLLISKDLILLLLGPIDTVSGIEKFIATLKEYDLFVSFEVSIMKKYMALLFKYGLDVSIHKPHMDRIYRNSSNIACARYLYSISTWKTTSCISIMLNGEVDHQPENLYQLYRQELTSLSRGQSKAGILDENFQRDEIFDPFCSPLSQLPVLPSEGCLVALLRASTKATGALLRWGKLFALQVAVHEFKKYVCTSASHPNTPCIYPSNKLWCIYLYALHHAGYILELADVIRWWESIRFIPEQETLTVLLLMLPAEVSERHIQHAMAVSAGDNPWPWPSIEKVKSYQKQQAILFKSQA